MIASWSVSWLLGLALAPGKRVIYVTDASEDAIKLPSYEPPHVQGQTAVRLGPGVFGFKNGSTLQVWPYDRHVSSVPKIAAPFHVVIDPILIPQSALLTPSASSTPPIPLAAMSMSTRFVVRWGLNEVSTKEMGLSCVASVEIPDTGVSVAVRTKVSIAAISDAGSTHLTMPFVCGNALGVLLQSKVARWITSKAPEPIKLVDALGRVTVMSDVMPAAEISAMGRKFRLRPEVSDEIRFTEIHG